MGNILRLLNQLPGAKQVKNSVNEEQYLPYYPLVNKKENVEILLQTGSGSSSIHHKKGLYLYNMK